MPRPRGDTTPDGGDWIDELVRAQQRVDDAERERDQLVRRALRSGLGVRGVARALRIDKSTVSRRYTTKAGS
jgi:DNA invertase Pin-like site-specific DNA recombinase